MKNSNTQSDNTVIEFVIAFLHTIKGVWVHYYAV